jgi:hypothetical protein
VTKFDYVKIQKQELDYLKSMARVADTALKFMDYPTPQKLKGFREAEKKIKFMERQSQ